MFSQIKKKYPTARRFILYFLACAAVTLFLTLMHYWFWGGWVILGSLAVAIVGTYIYRYYLGLFKKILPLTIDGVAEINGVSIYEQKARFPNAYAFGFLGTRAVIFNKILLELCTPAEVKAVLAHEAGHHHYKDFVWGGVVILAIGNGIASLATSFDIGLWASLWLAFGLCLPGVMVYLGYSRFKEKRADMYAARHLDNPEDLAKALFKMQQFMADKGYPTPIAETFMTQYCVTHPSVMARAKYLKSNQE